MFKKLQGITNQSFSSYKVLQNILNSAIVTEKLFLQKFQDQNSEKSFWVSFFQLSI